MPSAITRLGAVLILASQAFGSPLATVTTVEKRQTCQVQSCQIANIAGNTGEPVDITMTVQDSTSKGDCCIIAYNPSAASALFAATPSLKAQCPNGDVNGKFKRDVAVQEALEESLAPLEKRACTARTLIFSKGTFETGTFGNFVGPKLTSALQSQAPGEWTVTGISYSNTIFGDDCLGLPGGVIAKGVFEQTASSCPDTQIVMSGYSQGAMVVRNAIGNSTLQSRVKGLVTFGDPFDGAPVGGYSGPIKTFCASGDKVCDGLLDISGAHLSYGSDATIAATYINSLF